MIEDRGDIRSPQEVIFYPNALPALKLLAQHFMLFIVTNQSAIGKGSLASHEVEEVNHYVQDRIAKEGIEIKEIYVCPHTTEQGCSCKKPKPFFLEKAANDHDLDLSRSFVIGDHTHDIEFAKNAGAEGVYVLTGHGMKHKKELLGDCTVCPDVLEAAQYIIRTRIIS